MSKIISPTAKEIIEEENRIKKKMLDDWTLPAKPKPLPEKLWSPFSANELIVDSKKEEYSNSYDGNFDAAIAGAIGGAI